MEEVDGDLDLIGFKIEEERRKKARMKLALPSELLDILVGPYKGAVEPTFIRHSYPLSRRYNQSEDEVVGFATHIQPLSPADSDVKQLDDMRYSRMALMLSSHAAYPYGFERRKCIKPAGVSNARDQYLNFGPESHLNVQLATTTVGSRAIR